MKIKATIIADSVSPQGVRLTTFELEYPRFIHAEVMTHRVFSRNAQSSRAVPVSKSLEQEIVTPFVWGKNRAGMSSNENLSEQAENECAYYWHALVRYCQDFAERMSKAGLHKQWANRCLEWFSPIKVVVTATEWDNFFWLRIDPEAAQPEIVELASKMHFEMQNSNPQELHPGQWHLPYVRVVANIGDLGEPITFYEFEGETLDPAVAKKVSAGCCAAVSYRNNPSIEKCLEIWDKLFSGPKPHLSPVEHQATPISFVNNPYDLSQWPDGVTHMDASAQLWSGNLLGWVQQRQVM